MGKTRLKRRLCVVPGSPSDLIAALSALGHYWMQAALFGATSARWMLFSALRGARPAHHGLYGRKHAADPIRLAVLLARTATGKTEDSPTEPAKAHIRSGVSRVGAYAISIRLVPQDVVPS